jgi:hypothetical protein
MKQQFVNVVTKLSFLTVFALFATSAQGQSLSNGVRATIPFDFVVSGKTLPAGKYSITRVQQDDTVLRVSSADGRLNSIRLTNPVRTGSPEGKTRLVFHRYGDQYFLFQIWPGGSTTGRQMFKSRGEDEIARRLATNPSAFKTSKDEGVLETVTIVGELQ